MMSVTTRFTNKTLWKGMIRGGVWGLGLNALGTLLQDLWNNPCRAPREFALNMATSIGYGLVSAIGASIIGALLFTAGAPMVAVTVGTYFAGVIISVGLDIARANYDMPDFERRWRQQNR